jgi:hypothetical protein
MQLSSQARLALIFVGGLLIGLAVAAAVVRLTMRPSSVPGSPSMSVTPSTPQDEIPPSSVVVPVIPTSSNALPVAMNEFGSLRYVTSTQQIDTTPLRLAVDWEKRATDVTAQASDIFASLGFPKELYASSTVIEDVAFGDLWFVATVRSGVYVGSKVYLLRTLGFGLGTDTADLFVMVPSDGSTPRIIEGYWNADDSYPPLITDRMINMPNAWFEGFFAPETMHLESGAPLTATARRLMHLAGTQYTWLQATNPAPHPIGRTKEGMPFELASPGIFVVNPNGQIVQYQSYVPSVPSERGYGSHTVAIQLSNGKQETWPLITQAMSGCGAFDMPNVVSSEKVPLGRMRVYGSIDGQPVYVFSNPANELRPREIYDTWYIPEQTQKPDFDTFIKRYPYPVFYWKNGLGEWIEMTHADFMPAVECGKPVIYLYPEKTTNVSVKLPSFIHVTVSEPAYPSNGWNVVAHPDGSLAYADGNTYGSLFWEGTGVGYEMPKDGFVLKDGEVDTRLATILAQYGLNDRESQEFRDFWVPKMTGAPYYRVSFLTDAWSKAAPLMVRPVPRTSIRIFMDWQKLSAPMSIPEPKIVTPTRDGFTVVEWGGLLRT